MVQKIIWSGRAIKDFDSIVNFLFTKFGQHTVYTFHTLLLKRLYLIQSNPSMYSLTAKRNVRKAVVNKRLIILYTFKPRKNLIEIISLWDTRRHK